MDWPTRITHFWPHIAAGFDLPFVSFYAFLKNLDATNMKQ